MKEEKTENQIHQKLKEISDDTESGASEFIEKVLNIFEIFANTLSTDLKENKQKLNSLSRKIINLRPSMATLINTVGFIITDLDEVMTEPLKERIREFRTKRKKIQENLKRNISNLLNSYKKDLIKLMLISYSSTIINILLNLENINLELFVLESRPLLEGRKTANILSDKYPVHILIDAAMGFFIGEVDIVFVGIDSILNDGSIVNKIGTYPLAVISKANSRDIYAVGTSLKYNLRNHYDKEVKIEEKPKNEIINDEKILKNEIFVHNYYFDVTPAKFITGLISELGVSTPENFIKSLENCLPINWFRDFILK